MRKFISMLGRMNIFSDRLAIDPGTDRTLLYTTKKGIVVNEPSIVAVGVNGKPRPHIVAVGEEAGNMLGKTPAQIEVVRPIRDGAVVNFEATCAMLKHFIKIGCKRRKLAGFQAVIAVPSGITQIEMDAVIEAVKSAGAGKVFLIEGAVAGALGARFYNSGQICVGANRFFVHKKIHKEFAEELTERVKQMKTGPNHAAYRVWGQ